MFIDYNEKVKRYNEIRNEWNRNEEILKKKRRNLKSENEVFFLESKEELRQFFEYVDKLKKVENEIVSKYGEEMLFKFQISVGFIKQDGEYIWIEGIAGIDKSIVELIKKLNDLGFETKYCCSGVEGEHKNNPEYGYITFQKLNSDNFHILKNLAIDNGFEVLNFKECLHIRNEEKNDERIIEKWNNFMTVLEDFKN